jgi:hypothetical protein
VLDPLQRKISTFVSYHIPVRHTGVSVQSGAVHQQEDEIHDTAVLQWLVERALIGLRGPENAVANRRLDVLLVHVGHKVVRVGIGGRHCCWGCGSRQDGPTTTTAARDVAVVMSGVVLVVGTV